MTLPLTPKQYRAALLIAQGLSQNEIAGTLGLERRTLYRWRQQPAFVEYLAGLLREQEKEVMQNLYSLRLRAIETLSNILASDNESIALKAATEVLNRTVEALPSTHVIKDETDKRAAWDKLLAGLPNPLPKNTDTDTENNEIISTDSYLDEIEIISSTELPPC